MYSLCVKQELQAKHINYHIIHPRARHDNPITFVFCFLSVSSWKKNNHHTMQRAEIQLLLKRFPDSSIFSLILAGWCEEGHSATKNYENVHNEMIVQIKSDYIRILPFYPFQRNDCSNLPANLGQYGLGFSLFLQQHGVRSHRQAFRVERFGDGSILTAGTAAAFPASRSTTDTVARITTAITHLSRNIEQICQEFEWSSILRQDGESLKIPISGGVWWRARAYGWLKFSCRCAELV